jgi:glyoxalase family protein
VDENPATLGEQLILPPFLESRRAEIVRALTPITMPRVAAAPAHGGRAGADDREAAGVA